MTLIFPISEINNIICSYCCINLKDLFVIAMINRYHYDMISKTDIYIELLFLTSKMRKYKLNDLYNKLSIMPRFNLIDKYYYKGNINKIQKDFTFACYYGLSTIINQYDIEGITAKHIGGTTILNGFELACANSKLLLATQLHTKYICKINRGTNYITRHLRDFFSNIFLVHDDLDIIIWLYNIETINETTKYYEIIDYEDPVTHGNDESKFETFIWLYTVECIINETYDNIGKLIETACGGYNFDIALWLCNSHNFCNKQFFRFINIILSIDDFLFSLENKSIS
jgi:hypothetical protein